MGSSPLSRGIPPQRTQLTSQSGIIPALAGNTTSKPPPDPASRDHPRSRGEYHRHVPVQAAPQGSSPLSRGIRHRTPSVSRRSRIIPALAGNTPAGGFGVQLRQDHPRSRGEYSPNATTCNAPGGSSPLSRGIPSNPPVPSCRRGIIPALAGNTPHVSSRVPSGTDHPRSRGEYFLHRSPRGGDSGSSPLSRGILQLRTGPLTLVGIIPALAGNTSAANRPHSNTWDHPRSRGEYARKRPQGETIPGSSPLSRGIPTQ